jgi:AraC family transcriptional regulator of adaptative response / DNA-3-methyladenine glycosylase II
LTGVEVATSQGFRRAIRLNQGTTPGHGLIEVNFTPDRVDLTVTLTEADDLNEAVQTVGNWLDLSADSAHIDAVLRRDPALKSRVTAVPGLRVPGTADPFETAVRAIIGQQVSVAGARTVAGRLAVALGQPLKIPDPEITHLFPDPADVLTAPEDLFAMPAARRETIRRLAEAVATGALNLEVGPDNPAAAITESLLALKGIGPWTASYIAMRALGDRDVFLPTDLGVVRSLERLGHSPDPERWRPYRSYALHHLWLPGPR